MREKLTRNLVGKYASTTPMTWSSDIGSYDVFKPHNSTAPGQLYTIALSGRVGKEGKRVNIECK